MSRNEAGSLRVQVDLREGSKLEVISQNFCDRRSWYTGSTRKTAVALVDSGDGLTWDLPSAKTVVDVTHGRLAGEALIRDTYRPVVRVDSVEMAEHSADSTFTFDANGDEVHTFANGDADYGIDYETGSVTFKVSQAGKSVEMDYSEVGGSSWYLTPEADKKIILRAAELQFSADSRMKSAFVFQPRALVEKHPLLQSYWDGHSPPGPYPAGTKLPLGPPTRYESKMDLIAEANTSYPVIPKDEGPGLTWRDLPCDVQIYRWDYAEQAAVCVTDEHGMDIEISLDGDTPAEGSYAVVTFYGLSEPLD